MPRGNIPRQDVPHLSHDARLHRILDRLRAGQGLDPVEAALLDAYVRELKGDRRELQSRVLKLEELITTDELTGKGNRRGFERHLSAVAEHAATASYAGNIFLLAADLDEFKRVNDLIGHDAGDEVLRAAGDYLSMHLKAGDYLARISGDEFGAILYTRAEPGDIPRVITGLRQRMPSVAEGFADAVLSHFQEIAHGTKGPSTYDALRRHSIKPGMSIGLARIEPEMAIRAACRHAEDAMYHAKIQGTGAEVWTPGKKYVRRERHRD